MRSTIANWLRAAAYQLDPPKVCSDDHALAMVCVCAWNNVPNPTPTMLEWVNNHADVGMKGWHRVAHAVLQHLEQEK